MLTIDAPIRELKKVADEKGQQNKKREEPQNFRPRPGPEPPCHKKERIGQVQRK